jgi:hypothetical protein
LSTGRLAVGARRASARGGGAPASRRERTVPTVPRRALRTGAVRRRREIAERVVASRLSSPSEGRFASRDCVELTPNALAGVRTVSCSRSYPGSGSVCLVRTYALLGPRRSLAGRRRSL